MADSIDETMEKQGEIVEKTEIKTSSRDYIIYLIGMPCNSYSVQRIKILNGTGEYEVEEKIILKNQHMEEKAKYAFQNMVIKTKFGR